LAPASVFPAPLSRSRWPSTTSTTSTACSKQSRSARLRTPSRATHKWLRFEAPPSGTQPLIVGIAVEHTPQAIEYAKNTLRPRILAGTPLVLDFRKIDFCTQSFLHALLYEIIRLAWATKNTIYIVNASPGVRSGLELLENYALGG
jgi:hypothetical protein